MRTATLAILGATLTAATMIQAASATGRHHVRKVARAPVSTGQTLRNANAYYWPARPSVPDWVRYSEGGAISAPAGR